MKSLETIIVPTDLTDGSRRAVEYAAGLAAANNSQLFIMHVANEFVSWELHDDAFGYSGTWPVDRMLNEAAIELNRFLESHRGVLNRVPVLHLRLIFGSIPEQIIALARQEKADLLVLSPRRRPGWQSLFNARITERITRMSPCPVLSIAPPLPAKQWHGKPLPISPGWSRPSVEPV